MHQIRTRYRGRDKRLFGDSEEWLITYSDLVTLILVFFLLLIGFSTVDYKRYSKAMESIKKALGGKIEQEIIEGLEKAGPGEVELKKLHRQVEALIKSEDLSETMAVELNERGLAITSQGSLFFRSASAELLPGPQAFLVRVADLIRSLPFRVEVEGHTDDVPIRTEHFPSNWELSASRAAAVTRFLITQGGVSAERFSAVGYAQYRPRFEPTPENRPKNRRVEILITREGARY